MNARNETGHAKNVANMQKLIEQVTVYTSYNPPVENLTLVSLLTLYTTSNTQLNAVEEKRNANKNAIHLRQVAFEPLKPTCTRIINQLEVLGLSEGTIEQAKSLNRLIQGGQKKTAATAEEGEEIPKNISTSRQSYTQQAENFGILVQLLSTIPSYNPNEDDLKLASLTTYQASLMSATQAVDHTEAELNVSIIERNQTLYADGTGLYTIAQNVKKYLKSAYGATSPEYSKISKIKFSDYKL